MVGIENLRNRHNQRSEEIAGLNGSRALTASEFRRAGRGIVPYYERTSIYMPEHFRGHMVSDQTRVLLSSLGRAVGAVLEGGVVIALAKIVAENREPMSLLHTLVLK